MASVHIDFIYSASDQNKITIVYRINHGRTRASIVSDITFTTDNTFSNTITTSRLPRAIRELTQFDVDRIYNIISELNSSGLSFTAKDIVLDFSSYIKEYTIKRYMQKIIAGLKEKNRIRTSETYQSALNSFMKFRKGKDIHLRLISAELIEQYETFLMKTGIVPNTVSFYMRIIRAVYNRAADEGITRQDNPFKHVYTGVAETVKRALPLCDIRNLKNIDLTHKPALEYARDIFLLSFYMRGMSFIDMAYLRKSDLCGDTIRYRRHKTGKMLAVKWTNEMETIVKRYSKNDNKFLIPIFSDSQSDSRSNYRNISSRINNNLKILGRMIGMTAPLTLYCARHSWASIAHEKGVPVSIISAGMGHRTENTTRIYLATLDTSAVDRANHSIIRLLH